MSKLIDSIYNGYIKGNSQLLPIIDYISNQVLVRKLSVVQKILKVNEAFRLYQNLLENNPSETIRKTNPIDMTAILKVLLSELNCKKYYLKHNSCADFEKSNISINKNGNQTSITVKMKTFDEIFG